MERQKLLEGLLPKPKKIKFDDNVYKFENDSRVYSNSDNKSSFKFLLRLCGMDGRMVEASSVDGSEGAIYIVIGKKPEKLSLLPEYKSEEAYALEVADESVTIVAHTEKGLSYGLKTLAKLNSESNKLPGVIIQDEPSTTFRGLHLCIFYPEDGTEKEDTSPASIKKMLTTAALSGYNHVFLEFWGMFPYQRRPYAVWPNDIYTTEVVRELIDFAIDDLHITPCPSQNMTSHAGWSRIMSRKHVVLDQRPDLHEMWVPGGWCFATENPDTKAYLKDIMDELLEAFRNPPLFNVCCDKCFGFGSTEEDRTIPADILFMKHLCFLNSYLAERGTRMLMWSDMLYTSMDSLTWKADPKVVDYLPKNVLISVWTHNDPGPYWYDVEFFENKGFQTIYAPFINKEGIRNMIRLREKYGSYGILQTTWHRPRTAVPSVVLSGGLQWNNVGYSDEVIRGFAKKGTAAW